MRQNLQSAEHVAAEPFWHNARFSIDVDKPTALYFSTTVEVNNVSDIIDGQTDQPFTMREWSNCIEELHQHHHGTVPTQLFLAKQTRKIKKIIKQVPAAIIRSAKRPPEHTPAQDEAVALVSRDDGSLRYAIYDPDGAQHGNDTFTILLNSYGLTR